mmetsp:Transcript_1389/g.1486  ORF Transcript_1389/g.1486 Transcript_1389/m.1486 type:complete len:83 (+) Transcript_1389:105-353(+)
MLFILLKSMHARISDNRFQRLRFPFSTAILGGRLRCLKIRGSGFGSSKKSFGLTFTFKCATNDIFNQIWVFAIVLEHIKDLC